MYAEYPDMTRLKPPAPSASLSHCFSVSVHHLGFKTCLVRTVCRNKHCSCDTFECTEMMNGLDVLVTRHLQYGVVATVLDPLVLFRAIYYFLLCLLAVCEDNHCNSEKAANEIKTEKIHIQISHKPRGQFPL